MAFNAHLPGTMGGFIGVDIFFVLSGFLITTILVQSHRSDLRIALKDFYVRRAFRLLPALSVLALFCVGYALLIQAGDKTVDTLKGVGYTILYVANWAQVPPNPPGIGPLSHAWSLSVEEQFYIVWPIFLMALLKLRRKLTVIAILAALILASAVYTAYLWDAKVSYFRMYFGSDTRAQELLIGCVAGLLFYWSAVPREGRAKRAFHTVSVVAVLGIGLSIVLARYNEEFVYTGGFTLICLGTAALILDLVLFPSFLSRCFEVRPLVWVGKVSYGLYLWHYPIFEASKRMFEGRISAVSYTIIGVAITVPVAAASYYFLEQPLLRLGRRYTSVGATSYLLTPIPRAVEGA